MSASLKILKMNPLAEQSVFGATSCFPDGNVVPDLLTEEELIRFLRIPEVSHAQDHHNAVLNLIRFRGLPRIRIGKRLLFPRRAVLEWIGKETKWE